jgi:Mg-chelatase subunit ChlD
MTVEPEPDDLSWLARPPAAPESAGPADPIRVYLLIDVSASMTGEPLAQARAAAGEFLSRCDFTRMEVGLISFSNQVVLQAEATDNPRKVHAAIGRLEPESTTNLTDALALAAEKLSVPDRTRYVVLLTDGYPDSPGSAVEQAERMRARGIEIVAIGTGDADADYLRQLASTEEGSIFAQQGELVQTFGRIARVIASGGRALRKLS